MKITTREAQGLFTKFLVDVYKERPQVMSFGRSFFPSKVSNSLNLSIEVQRGTEKIAVDVIRGADGNRNSISKSTETIIQPPFYHEYFDMTQLDLYNTLWSATEIDAGMFEEYTMQVADNVDLVRNKIERAYEKQCWDVLTSGIVTLESATSINFQRKSASMVDGGGGTYWTVNTVDPAVIFQNAATFLRTVGKVQGGTYNVIMAENAFSAFVANSLMQTRAWIRNFHLDNIVEPQRNSVGGVYQGRYSAGAYTFDIWTYPEYYDNNPASSTHLTHHTILPV